MGAPLLQLLKPQFGIQTPGNYGINTTATRQFLNIETFSISPEQDKQATGVQGLKFNVRSNLYKESAKLSVKATFDYIDCGYFFSSIEGLPTEGEYSPGGGPVAGVYQHVWEPNAYNEDSFQGYSIEFPGSVGDRVQRVDGAVFDSYKLQTESAKKLSIEFTGYSKAIQDEVGGNPITSSTGQNDVQVLTLTDATGGTFVVVDDNQQTAPIAYNASAATFQTAYRALGGGHATALVTGGAGGPYTITDVNGTPQQTLSVLYAGLTGVGATAAVTHPTVGGMKANQSYEVMPTDISIGWAASLAGLDSAPTTPVNQFKTDLEVSGRHQGVYRQNPSDTGFAYIKGKKASDQKCTGSAMLAYEAEVANFIASSRAVSTGMYFRIMFTGQEIGTTGVNRSLAFDFFAAVQWKTADGDYDDIRVCEFDLDNLFDTNGIFVRRITAINELASYATA